MCHLCSGDAREGGGGLHDGHGEGDVAVGGLGGTRHVHCGSAGREGPRLRGGPTGGATTWLAGWLNGRKTNRLSRWTVEGLRGRQP